MPRHKIDSRIRTLIESGVESRHRTMFIIIGNDSKDQVTILHHMLSKAAIKARPSVLWCYKSKLGFTSHQKKRMKQIEKKVKSGKLNVKEDDTFELFVASTNIRYCYYAETQKILGNTYGMCVLQDFEALTPNLLARTIETVEGGGLIVFLVKSLTSLKQLYTMAMDIHDRYRTEAHRDVVGRFNERFLLSLVSCDRCLVVDDQLKVLPISSSVLDISKPDVTESKSSSDAELDLLKEKLKDTQPISCLINCCKTLDQAKALLKFVESITEKTLKTTVSLTASRGRGKSAALGLSVAAAVAFGYANIFVTSPSPENLKTFFEFVLKGFDALEYQEHIDFGLVQSTNPEFNKALIRINVFKKNRQTIQYIHPKDSAKLSHAELLIIDEAAAIPLPLVRNMLGPYLIFLSSTINGYEGTGRSLSLKLIQQLRKQNSAVESNAAQGRTLVEITLIESIRYREGDSIEKWLSDLLCLDVTSLQPSLTGSPPPQDCNLYYINRDTLFCYHKASEAFLKRVVSLFVSSHYKNSPNDLQMMSDAPAHHLFCLLGPIDPNQTFLPEVLCVIQVCLEGELSDKTLTDSIGRGKKHAGDLIPWTVSQQFQDKHFPTLSGARIVRIATHPDYQSMGYGSRALSLLIDYYSDHFDFEDIDQIEYKRTSSSPNDDIYTEVIEPRNNVPPLLQKLNERSPEKIDYIGVSYGLTQELLKFWKRSLFLPVYIRQTTNDLTGEHSCIMIRSLEIEIPDWLRSFHADFSKRYVSLLGYQLRSFPVSLAHSVLSIKNCHANNSIISKEELDFLITSYDLKRLELFCTNLIDYHLVVDLLPTLAKLYFLRRLGCEDLTALQSVILLGIGLQYKTVEEIASERQINIPCSQLLGLFHR